MKIAIGGSAADPPHRGHYAVLESLLGLQRFDLVIWVLSGFRKDKENLMDPDDRVAMTELMLPHQWRLGQESRLVVRYDDVYRKNTPTIVYLEQTQRQYRDAKIVWFTGVDSVVPLADHNGQCAIEARWERGKELMEDWNFLILNRPGYQTPKTLPPNFEVLDFPLPNISSSEIRQRIKAGQPFEHLLFPDVANYIKQHRLYGYEEKRS